MVDDLKEALDRLNKGKTLEDVKKIVSKHVPEEIFAKKRKVKAVVETETSSDEIAVEEI